jgi:hypothetical protein
MTQALYAHMNNKTIKKKELQQPEELTLGKLTPCSGKLPYS